MTGPQPTPPGPLLRVRGLTKRYPRRDGAGARSEEASVHALEDLSFDLHPGETLGLVGESGSGKTTAARCLVRAFTPTAGSAEFRLPDGRVIDLATAPERALKPVRPHLQMIFQDPYSSLNPRMTVGEIVGEPLDIHRRGDRAERRARVVDMLGRVGLSAEDADRFPQAFSGGQRQRIGIARALILRPSLVVADEPVSALDVSIQAQVINLLKDLQAEFGLTYLLVAHNLDVVRHVCDRVAVMYAGRLVELAPTERIFSSPQHPYTQALLAARPLPDPDVPMNFDLAGDVSEAHRPATGCAFRPRCPLANAACALERPPLRTCGGPGHAVACHVRAPGGAAVHG